MACVEADGDLSLGARGLAVSALQERLAAAGIASGVEDGRFGGATRAAVMVFQRRMGLQADGVAGPATRAALGRAGPAFGLSAGDVCRMFPDTPRGTIERNLPGVLAALREAGLGEKRLVLAALATIRAEAEGFEPVEEAVSAWNTSAGGHEFDLYDDRVDLGNRGAPDGADFRGRGYVQLTGRRNYAIFGAAIGLPSLIAAPWRACEAGVAARLLAAFIAARRAAISSALEHGDLARARRAVNGGTNGLERFSQTYRMGAGLAG